MEPLCHSHVLSLFRLSIQRYGSKSIRVVQYAYAVNTCVDLTNRSFIQNLADTELLLVLIKQKGYKHLISTKDTFDENRLSVAACQRILKERFLVQLITNKLRRVAIYPHQICHQLTGNAGINIGCLTVIFHHRNVLIILAT